jgi:hypothetical protein
MTPSSPSGTSLRWSRAAAGALVALSIGCSTTRTTTTIRTTEAPSVQRVRLIRPDAEPLRATWRQEGRTLVGQLSYTDACQAETRQVVQREKVTETGGRWLGQPDERGAVRIQLGANVNLGAPQLATFHVESARPEAAAFARPGLPLGELQVGMPMKSAKR